ncbi:MAG: sensor histidine kinase [Phaeodactylibacter sp.]|nr:sensor histidine kinase [Phaeodactylibacter sp.]
MNRIALHIAFWLAYWLITGYIESILAGASFSEWPLSARLALGYTVELAALPIKILAVYWFLYRLIPRHLGGRPLWGSIVAGAGVMAGAAVLFRLLIQYVYYPYLYGEAYEFGNWHIQASRFLWAFLDIFYVVGIAVAIKMARLRMQALEREKQLVQEKAQSELNFLRAQTNPHFLFNTLNNIYGLARRQSPQTADIVMRLSNLLRYMIYECTEPAVPLEKELKLLESYIELERLRYGERLEASLKLDIDDHQQPIAPLLLLPLVENAFKHGSGESRFKSAISVQLCLKKGKLKLNVRNTADPESRNKGKGIGLRNLRRQLELLYPGAHELHTGFEGEEYIAELTINLGKHAKNTMPYR